MAKKKKPGNRLNLPVAHRNAELQQHSIRAITNCLPPEMFVFRQESDIDAGVDGTIELKIRGDHKTSNAYYTNMIARVQIKSQEKGEYNCDGSISLTLKSTNLEYLLNGPCPLYILYVLKTDDLRFVWARDEKNRIQKGRPNWQQGGTVTLRFTEKLNRASLESIYERIREESILTRKTHDVLSRGSVTEKTSITIDRQALTVSDPNELSSTAEPIFDSCAPSSKPFHVTRARFCSA